MRAGSRRSGPRASRNGGSKLLDRGESSEPRTERRRRGGAAGPPPERSKRGGDWVPLAVGPSPRAAYSAPLRSTSLRSSRSVPLRARLRWAAKGCMTSDFPTPATVIDAGALGVADGLLILIRESPE